MSEDYEDWCDDDGCGHDAIDHNFMVEHEVSAADFDHLYGQLLSYNKDFGTYMMDELQTLVKKNIEAGQHD